MSSQPYDPDSFLTGGGVPGAFSKDDPIGTTVAGIITERPEVKQQTDIGTGKPDTWDNGDPKLQLVVTIQADGVPVTDDDDGRRRFYVAGSKKAGSQSMHDAVASAVRAAKARGLDVGGHLAIRFVGTEPSSTRGFSDRKLWAAQYKAPDASAAFFGTGSAAARPAEPGQSQFSIPATPAPAAAPPGFSSAEQAESFAAWQASQQQPA